MNIRAEQPRDYNAVARLTYCAFLNWRKDDMHIHEPDMVTLARQSVMFDPELSIVAEEGGEIVGHILLLPADFIVLGKETKGVILGPVSVSPEMQKQGIGAKLIEYAHDKAKAKGYEFCILCGHPVYYPKFGYLQNVFSFNGTKIEKVAGGNGDTLVTRRPLMLNDIDILDKWQQDLRRDEPFALLFEKDIMGYHAFSKEKTGEMLEIGDVPVAYVKYKTYQSDKLDFIFYERNKIESVIDYLMSEREGGTLEIAQPPHIFKQLLPYTRYKVTDERKAFDAFMIHPFDETAIINEYCKEAKANADMMGVISFPPYCDV